MECSGAFFLLADFPRFFRVPSHGEKKKEVGVRAYLSNAFAFVLFCTVPLGFISCGGSLSLRWADVGEDRHNKVSLAFLRRKKRLGMMVKLLTKLISSSSKVLSIPSYLIDTLPFYGACFRAGTDV